MLVQKLSSRNKLLEIDNIKYGRCKLSTAINETRELVNHSTRKHFFQKPIGSNIPPTEIAQITAHNNINSINNTQYFPTRNSNKFHLFCLLLPLQKKTFFRLWKLMKFVQQSQNPYSQHRVLTICLFLTTVK